MRDGRAQGAGGRTSQEREARVARGGRSGRSGSATAIRAGAADGQQLHGQQDGACAFDAGAMAAPTEQAEQLPQDLWCGESSPWPLS